MNSAPSLDPYRTEGVQLFAGTTRGRKVAQCIKEEYGNVDKVKVPEDVLHIESGFRAGFREVLSGCEFENFESRFEKNAP